jgi:hypothetical protein
MIAIILTPKHLRPFFGPILKFEQAIVDAIFVQKISNFRWTCGLVLASSCTNFYKILISSLGAMPQKQNYFEVQATWATKKLFTLKLFWVEFFFINSSQESWSYHQLEKVLWHMEFTRKMLKDFSKVFCKDVVDLSTFL